MPIAMNLFLVQNVLGSGLMSSRNVTYRRYECDDV